MYLVSLQGHVTSFWPGSRGYPTEWRQRTNSPSPRRSSAAWPMRVMMRMDMTTYSESVNCTPILGSSLSSGPMPNGTTYMVRPRMLPRKCSVISAFILSGSTQWLVGPAPSSVAEQMNVRDSTRATSEGLERARNELGRFSSFRRMRVPESTNFWETRSHSSREPSAKTTSSGVSNFAASAIQCNNASFLVGASPTSPGISTLDIKSSCHIWFRFQQ